MKKIILTAGMLVAIASASFAQNNTTSIVQTDGARNDIKSTQTGQNLNATFNQAGVMTTDNKAEVVQTGKGNTATITEKGKLNSVFIEQLSSINSLDKATVNISGNDSERNKVNVSQLGKLSEATIDISGDDNTVNTSQGGDQNRLVVDLSITGLNDGNTVSIGQLGNRNQTSATVVGDGNTVTVSQKGFDNTIGTVAPSGNLSVTATPSAGPPAQVVNPNTGITPPTPAAIVTVGNQTVVAPNTITVQGDRNMVAVTQGADTRDNQVAIRFQGTGPGGNDGGANNNSATVNQLDNAENNKAVIQVSAGMDRNLSLINQTGNARFNEAGIRQEGSDDIATINQTGENNSGIIIQRVNTTVGSNMATINQPGVNNEAYIIQEGTYASKATITQNQNGGSAVIIQTGTGGHDATLTQNSTLTGSRLILRQEGANNSANLTQVNFDQFTIPDVEVIQQGNNNTIGGIGFPSNVIKRVTQIGSNNLTL